MSQNYYKLYVDSIFSLASTIVIKSVYSAETINNYLKLVYGEQEVDPYNPSSWKYYLNVCGIYHPRDEQISITSLDTGVQIVFDNATLKNHPLTLNSYSYGSRYYRELVTLHPDKELMIIGSIYPAELNSAIQADDGAVLAYPKDLVETQELSLISNIESWIKRFKARWDNAQFNVSDSLYGATNLGVMYLQLIPLIFNLRLSACKTNEVHSFHIRQYLASHGMLDTYLDQLSLKQALFLYRNITYIERNNGKKEIFSWLVDRILTDRGIPLASYSMRHNTANINNTVVPIIGFKRKEINDIYSGSQSTNTRIDLKRLLSKEELDAPQNNDYSLYNVDRIQKQLEYSSSSVVATKVLESSMVDYSSDDPYPLIDIQLNHWLYYSSIGIYNAKISFQEPRTGVEITLTAFEAYVYWFYIYCKSIGSELNIKNLFADNSIPDFLANRVVKLNRVTVNEFRSIADINDVAQDVIAEILYSQVGVMSLTSVEAFTNKCIEILNQSNYQNSLLSIQQHMDNRAMVKGCINTLYHDVRISTDAALRIIPVASRTFPDWLNERGIVDHEYTSDECVVIYSKLFEKATGGSLYSTLALTNLQKSMIKLMKQLSSYSIQFITEINKSSIRKLNWGAIRLGDILPTQSRLDQLTEYKIMPSDIVSDEQNLIPVDCEISSVNTVTGTIQSDQQEVSISTKPYLSSDVGTLHHHEVRFGTITINPCFYNDPALTGGIKRLDSYEQYHNLTTANQSSIVDIYSQVYQPNPNAGKIKLSLTILRDIVPDFNYTKIKKKVLKAFKYNYVTQIANSGIRNLLSASIDAFIPNMGQVELEAYTLFNQTNIVDLFEYFGQTTVLNSFVTNSGEEYIDPNLWADVLGTGTSLNIFTGLTTPVQLQGFTYSQDSTNINLNFTSESQSVNFVKPFFTTSVALHPTEPGQIVNAFELLKSSSIIGGFEYNGYHLSGFSINGNQIEFNN